MTATPGPALPDRCGDENIPTLFDPERHRLHVAALDYGIGEAKRIKDWPALEAAVDGKVAEQQKFVAWWDVTIRSQGEARKKESRERGILSVTDAERLTGMKHQRVSDLRSRLKHPEKYRADLLGAEYQAAMLAATANVRGTQGTGENEWFTPPEYVEAVRAVLGEIDLDPATHEEAQKTVQAAHYFTKADDGLTKEWHGRVFLNPPYAQPLIGKFVGKMCAERRAGHVESGIMLTHNYTDTAWFREAVNTADGICFTSGRIKFRQLERESASPTQGQAFFYLGNDVEKFLSGFAEIGWLCIPAMMREFAR